MLLPEFVSQNCEAVEDDVGGDFANEDAELEIGEEAGEEKHCGGANEEAVEEFGRAEFEEDVANVSAERVEGVFLAFEEMFLAAVVDFF